MKSTPAFLRLPVGDQLSLLEEGWREMFVLGAAQFQLPIEAASLLSAAGISPDKSPSDDSIAAIAEIRVLQDTIAKFRSMQVDRSEYACLKGIVIFKTGSFTYFYKMLLVQNSRRLHFFIVHTISS